MDIRSILDGCQTTASTRVQRKILFVVVDYSVADFRPEDSLLFWVKPQVIIVFLIGCKGVKSIFNGVCRLEQSRLIIGRSNAFGGGSGFTRVSGSFVVLFNFEYRAGALIAVRFFCDLRSIGVHHPDFST